MSRRTPAVACDHAAVSKDAVRPPWLRIPFAPACGALILFWLALSPSLLPRPAAFQGLLCGVAALLGYAAGALIGWLLTSAGLRLEGRARSLAWKGFAVVGVAGTLVALFLYLRWQRVLREDVGLEGLSYGHITVLVLVGLLAAVVLLAIARLLRAAGRVLGRQIARVLPGSAATVVGALIVGGVGWWLVDGVLAGRLVYRLDSVFMAINDEFRTDTPGPTSEALSAGPASAVEWDDLGRQGRVFIANAPSSEAIAEFSGDEAQQPVRAYVGVGTDGEIDLREEAQAAVRELEGLGGFERSVVNVATGTGRGWVNENQARGLEYMWNGDTATVSMQYSYLPSWMSFLVDGDRSQTAGRLLFEAVYERWLELPEDERPLLVVSGESLGTFGGEAAFSGAQDLRNRTDGALFVGPTANNRLWGQFTAERDAGSPEVLPVYQGGETIRFADVPEDWDQPNADWPRPRVGYLQHANDPVTWWDWGLAVHKPDWLREPRGRNVLPQTQWIPFVTMLQVAADQAVANAVPAGEGHQFGQAPVYAWAEILPPDGWTDADSDRLAPVIAEAPQLD